MLAVLSDELSSSRLTLRHIDGRSCQLKQGRQRSHSIEGDKGDKRFDKFLDGTRLEGLPLVLLQRFLEESRTLNFPAS